MTDSYRNQCSKTAKDISKLIPPYLSDFKMLAKTAELRVSYDAPTDQTTYTFTLKWEDEMEERESYRRLQSSGTSLRTLSSSELSSISRSTLSSMTQSNANCSVAAVMACCDGPCKRAVPSNKLNILGRCGHYLCDSCYGIVINSDGTKGCSSFSCNWTDDDSKTEEMRAYNQEICRLQRQRANAMKKDGFAVKAASPYTSSSLLSTKTSATFLKPIQTSSDNIRTMPLTKSSEKPKPDCNTYPSKHEIVIAKVVLIENNHSDETLHIYNQIEIATSINVRQVIEKMLHARNRSLADYLNHGSKLYYVCGLNDGTKKFRRVKTDQLNTSKLYEFPIIQEYVFFVLDTIGVLRKKEFEIVLGYTE